MSNNVVYSGEYVENKLPKTVVVHTLQAGDYTSYPINGDTVHVLYEAKIRSTNYKFEVVKSIPFKFTVGSNEVIEGLSLGIVKMCVGETAIIDIPSNYAYGEYGNTEKKVPPNEDVLYKLSLVKIDN